MATQSSDPPPPSNPADQNPGSISLSVLIIYLWAYEIIIIIMWLAAQLIKFLAMLTAQSPFFFIIEFRSFFVVVNKFDEVVK